MRFVLMMTGVIDWCKIMYNSDYDIHNITFRRSFKS